MLNVERGILNDYGTLWDIKYWLSTGRTFVIHWVAVQKFISMKYSSGSLKGDITSRYCAAATPVYRSKKLLMGLMSFVAGSEIFSTLLSLRFTKNIHVSFNLMS